MKLAKYTVWALVGMAVLFTSCEKTFDAVPPEIAIVQETDPEAWQETISIPDFKDSYDNAQGFFTTNVVEATYELIIKGRVISSDVAGNIYKYIVLETLTPNEEGYKEAIKVLIDAGSLSGVFPVGQVVALKCNTLCFGRYGDSPQLGVKTYNISNKREEPGRIPWSLAPIRMQRIGFPDASKVVPREITIPELLASGPSIYNTLVRIKDVHFTGKGSGGENLGAKDKIFAPSTFNGTYNVGYPQARQIADAAGNVTYIATSEYARFAEVKLPDPNKTGDIVAIVGWYRNKDSEPGDWQLTIRSLNDLSNSFGLSK